jgi:hypothetical protein
MIDYTTMVSDFTDLDPLDMYQRLKKVEEPRVSNRLGKGLYESLLPNDPMYN